jgi:hypothetical protein
VRPSSFPAAEMCRCYLGGGEKPRKLSARSCDANCEQGEGPLSRPSAFSSRNGTDSRKETPSPPNRTRRSSRSPPARRGRRTLTNGTRPPKASGSRSPRRARVSRASPTIKPSRSPYVTAGSTARHASSTRTTTCNGSRRVDPGAGGPRSTVKRSPGSSREAR